MKPVATIVGALFAIPMIGTLGVQLYAGIYTAKAVHDMQSAQEDYKRGPEDPFSGKIDVVNNTEAQQGGRLKREYVTMASYNDINANRYATVTVLLETGKLLAKGEKAPDADFREVFLSARAPFVGEAECQLLLQSIASTCRVERATGRPVRDSRTVNQFQVSLAFVPKEPFGKFDPNKTQYFVDIHQPLAGKKTHRAATSSLSRFQKDRERVYKNAAKNCKKLRKREGNCAINGIYVTANWNEKRRKVTYSARGSYAFLSSRASAVKSAKK